MIKYIEEEKLRLETVKLYAIFENGRDVNLDEITKTAALICNSRYSFISIIDEQLIRFISRYGFDLIESVREKSGCDIVITTKKPLIIDDSSRVEPGKLNKFYTDKINLLSYAGFPLITKDGVAIGTLSVADTEIKHLTESQILTLETFAKQVVRTLEVNKANMELEKIKKEFIEVQDICSIGHWELFLDTNEVKWSPGGYQIHGVEEGVSFDKASGISFYAPHERERIALTLNHAIETGESFCEDFEFKNFQGEDLWVRSSGRTVKDKNGNIVKLVGTLQDITNIRYQEKSKQFILDTMKVGTWNWDITNNILEWDDSNYNVFGVSKEDFSGAYEAWESTLHPDWKESATNDLQDALDGKCEFLTTFGINTTDGDLKYIGARGEIKRDEEGNPVSMIGINWDKTAEYKALITLEKQKNANFHQDKLASIGSLAAGVGHEINNPMAIIQGHCDFLKNRLSQNSIDKALVETSLKHIETSVERVTAIVKGLKNISRQDEDNVDTFDVQDVLHETVSAISDIYMKDGIEIKLNISDSSVVLGNRGRIQQVIINLLANAKDAMDLQKIKSIEIRLEKGADSSTIIKIKDSGSGIPKEIQNKIFDPFFTSKDVSKGTGIGLSLCHQIISDHKGEITFITSESNGTTFIIKLPKAIDDELKCAQPKEKIYDNIPITSGRILIAEDEVGIQEILQVLLEDIGYEVVVKSNGLEAYNEYISNKGKYDLILSDIQMPKMNGIDLFKKINSEDPLRPPFVIMTGGVSDNENEFIDKVDGIVSKPFTRETLADTLQKILRNKNDKEWAF